MSEIASLAAGPESAAAGAWHTAREIVQQPRVWPAVAALVAGRAPEIRRFLAAAGPGASFILAGAGSSDFVGRSVAGSLQARTGHRAAAVATTDIVTHPAGAVEPGRDAVVIHCARSGDSPESMAAWRFLHRVRPDLRHLVITCNPDGALGRAAAAESSALLLVLPPETNDRSLAMTSSFSGMTVAALALGWLDDLPGLARGVEGAAAAGRRVIEKEADLIAAFAARPFTRACCLGSGVLAGAMHEGALKLLEMTAGEVAAIPSSFLGIRHGPLVFIGSGSAVVACLSSDAAVRRYELDFLRGLRGRGQAGAVMAVCSGAAAAESAAAVADLVVTHPGEPIPDAFRVLTDIVACQVLAFSASRARGLSPDNPSPGGIISRVVQGVTIYDE
jgi:tagatose-6-phosphate ketose/aldose isomerase